MQCRAYQSHVINTYNSAKPARPKPTTAAPILASSHTHVFRIQCLLLCANKYALLSKILFREPPKWIHFFWFNFDFLRVRHGVKTPLLRQNYTNYIYHEYMIPHVHAQSGGRAYAHCDAHAAGLKCSARGAHFWLFSHEPRAVCACVCVIRQQTNVPKRNKRNKTQKEKHARSRDSICKA